MSGTVLDALHGLIHLKRPPEREERLEIRSLADCLTAKKWQKEFNPRCSSLKPMLWPTSCLDILGSEVW